jgi:hypothetical protein
MRAGKLFALATNATKLSDVLLGLCSPGDRSIR